MTCKFNADTSDGLKIVSDTSGAIDLQTNGTTKVSMDASGNLQFDSGYGSVVTAYGIRAWVFFNGTGTVAISDSGNVSSITDFTTGVYGVNLTTAMPDTNYSFVATAQRSGTSSSDFTVSERHNYTRTTSQFRVNTLVASTGSAEDSSRVNVMVVR